MESSYLYPDEYSVPYAPNSGQPVFTPTGQFTGYNTSQGFIPAPSTYVSPITGGSNDSSTKVILSAATAFMKPISSAFSGSGVTSAVGKGATAAFGEGIFGSSAGGVAGSAGLAAAGAYGGYNLYDYQSDAPRGDYARGGLQGAASGAAIGAAFGGPVGAVVGGVLGAVAGLAGAATGSTKGYDQRERDAWRKEQEKQGLFTYNESTKAHEVKLADGSSFRLGDGKEERTRYGTRFNELPKDHVLTAEAASYGNLLALLDGKYNSSVEKKDGSTGDSKFGVAAVYGNAAMSNADNKRSTMVNNFAYFLERKGIEKDRYNTYLQTIYNNNEISKEEYNIFKRQGEDLYRIIDSKKQSSASSQPAARTQGYY